VSFSRLQGATEGGTDKTRDLKLLN